MKSILFVFAALILGLLAPAAILSTMTPAAPSDGITWSGEGFVVSFDYAGDDCATAWHWDFNQDGVIDSISRSTRYHFGKLGKGEHLVRVDYFGKATDCRGFHTALVLVPVKVGKSG